jgi:hypothetical protein
LYDAIIDLGGTLTRFTEYPGVGHASWEPARREPALTPWAMSHVKGIEHGHPDPAENVTGEASSANRVDLRWDSPSDNTNPDNQVWYYNIFRDGELIAETDPVHTWDYDTDVSASTEHRYSVSVVNFFFHESEMTKEIAVNIPSGLHPLYTNSEAGFGLQVNHRDNELHYFISERQYVTITLYSIDGKIISTLYEGMQQEGHQQVPMHNNNLKPGLYFIRLHTDSRQESSKFVVTK